MCWLLRGRGNFLMKRACVHGKEVCIIATKTSIKAKAGLVVDRVKSLLLS